LGDRGGEEKGYGRKKEEVRGVGGGIEGKER
jgi:hypothetical protein